MIAAGDVECSDGSGKVRGVSILLLLMVSGARFAYSYSRFLRMGLIGGTADDAGSFRFSKC